jgi:pimeloyl-ACP methyl ester carboxylesterase
MNFHYVENNMFVRRQNPSAKKGTLLYVHGLGESQLCFEHLVGATELQNYRHLLPDLPGYGRSPWSETSLSLQEHADYLAAWLKKYNEKNVILIGHSMGGVIGLLFAESYPELLRAFVNVDGNISLEDCGYSGQAVQMGSGNFFSSGFNEMRSKFYKMGIDDPALRGYYVSTRFCNPRAYFQNSEELVKISKTERNAIRMANLKMPVYYIAGVPGGISKRSHALLNQSGIKQINIEPSGHWPFIDKPQEFINVLSRILNKV